MPTRKTGPKRPGSTEPTSGDVGEAASSDESRIDEILSAYGSELQFNPPLFKAYGAKLILDAKPLVESGDASAMLWCIAVAAEYGLPAPVWVARPYMQALEDVRMGRAGSWDEVFGRPHPKGAQLESHRWRSYIGPRIGQAVFEAMIGGRSIGKDLFDEIGHAFDMSATACEDAFRFAIKKGLLPTVKELRRRASEWPDEKARLQAAQPEAVGWEPELPHVDGRL